MSRNVSAILTFQMPTLELTDFGTVSSEFSTPLSGARVYDAPATVLPATPASDDLGLVGTNALTLSTGDVMGTSVSRNARIQVPVPHNYASGETLQVLVQGKITDAAAVVSATVDVACYLEDGTGTPSSDLCTTSAQSCNTTTETTYYFTITPTNVLRGQVLNVVVTAAVDDTGGGDACTLVFGRVGVKCNTRG